MKHTRLERTCENSRIMPHDSLIKNEWNHMKSTVFPEIWQNAPMLLHGQSLHELYWSGPKWKFHNNKRSARVPISCSTKTRGWKKTSYLCWLSLVCVGLRDGGVPFLFIPAPVHSSWVSCVWEERSSETSEYQTNKVKEGLACGWPSRTCVSIYWTYYIAWF